MPLNLSFSASAKLPALHANVSAGGSFSSKNASAPPRAKNYVSNGYVMNNAGYLANPSRAAQVAANNAGALTRAEASSMGLPMGGRR
jgi:hypothetical protein|uniref:Uncharacterized protein n=1 Tax=viral metagenome TaxID=1070528 RepID=A0A6C0EW61_9ZZZZ